MFSCTSTLHHLVFSVFCFLHSLFLHSQRIKKQPLFFQCTSLVLRPHLVFNGIQNYTPLVKCILLTKRNEKGWAYCISIYGMFSRTKTNALDVFCQNSTRRDFSFFSDTFLRYPIGSASSRVKQSRQVCAPYFDRKLPCFGILRGFVLGICDI